MHAFNVELLYVEHMLLFGSKFYQETLQACFYALHEAELQTVAAHWDKYPIRFPAHRKLIEKSATGSAYLLDVLELNTKLRCVLAWMGKSTD